MIGGDEMTVLEFQPSDVGRPLNDVHSSWVKGLFYDSDGTPRGDAWRLFPEGSDA